MVSQKVLKRAKECQKLINSGVSKRQAYKDAHIDQDTYNKYKELLTPEMLENTFEGIKTGENIYNNANNSNGGSTKKKMGRPRLEGMKKERINVNLEPKYIQMLKKESEERGIPFATIAASYIVEGLKRNNKDKEEVKTP